MEAAHVDPFLVEALENPRHRLTVLRMELDIKKFMQDPNQHQFEFQHLPTSYLRCAAHRVAQHYGLQTFAVDSVPDGSGAAGSKIIAVKTPDSKPPSVCLSEVHAKYTEKDTTDMVKIAIRQRPSKTSLTDVTELENRKNLVRTVEERKEEYEKARARIFNSSIPTDVEEGFSSVNSVDRRSFSLSRDEAECYTNSAISSPDENEKCRDGASRVAILRDREKDRWDPDYDRSYNRYVRAQAANQSMGLEACNFLQPPFVQYETGQLLRNPQAPISYRPANPVMNPLCAYGCNQISSKNAVYHVPWPSPTMMYAQSYGHFRHAMVQAPGYQHPLSFEHAPNCL